MEVKNIFLTNSYKIDKKVQIILNWLVREGLQFMLTLNNKEKEKCKTSVGMFEVLSEHLGPSTLRQYNPCNIAN